MDYIEKINADLTLMMEACYRVWHLDTCAIINESAEEIRKMIDLATPKRIIEFGERDYICPNCENELNYEEYPNCYNCGQSLKW